jgi:hypothetical protein
VETCNRHARRPCGAGPPASALADM